MTAGQVETVRLGPSRTVPGIVRDKVRDALAAWNLAALAYDVATAANELVTNTIQHGEWPGRFWIYVHDGSLYLEVTDASPMMPVPRDAGDDDEDGRGYILIGELADAWGAEPLRRGKRVWARFDLDAPAVDAMDGCPCEAAGEQPTVVFERIAA